MKIPSSKRTTKHSSLFFFLFIIISSSSSPSSSSSSSLKMLLPLFLCLTLTTIQSAFTSITTAADLVAFANEVSSGTSPYRGSTVTLDADLDLSKVDFPGIGKTGGNNYCFRGVFEGNGHVISGMNLASSDSKYLGFFNCLNGGSVKDLVIDSSCSVTNGYGSESETNYAGGIAAYVFSGLSNSKMEILNCVNMAAVTGAGTYSRVGGIAGYVYALSSPVSVMNCANLGDIIHPETTEKTATIGGIVGWLNSENSQNFSSVVNCVNMGYIRTGAPNSGGVVGENTNSYNVVESNYWLKGTSERGTSGTITSTTTKNFNSSYVLSSGASLVDTLNNYASSSGLQKWGAVTFNMNGGNPVSSRMTMWLMLGAPDTPTKVGHTFVGWFTDAGFSNALDMNKRYGSGEGATLYAKWTVNKYTVTFNTNLGSPLPSATNDFGTTITLGTPTRTGYTFNGWNDEKGNTFTGSYEMNRAENVTLTAQWTPNNYTLTFNTNGGSSIGPITSEYSSTIPLLAPTRTGYTFTSWNDGKGNTFKFNYTINRAENVTLTAQWTINNYTLTFDLGNNVEEKILDFNETIEYPENLTRVGYEFLGWNNSITEMPANDLTITALWNLTASEFVEIVFDKKDMTESQIRELIVKFTQDDSYEIARFESDRDGTTVVLRFKDVNEAISFYVAAESYYREASNKLIKRIGFFYGGVGGFSLPLSVSSLYFMIPLVF